MADAMDAMVTSGQSSDAIPPPPPGPPPPLPRDPPPHPHTPRARFGVVEWIPPPPHPPRVVPRDLDTHAPQPSTLLPQPPVNILMLWAVRWVRYIVQRVPARVWGDSAVRLASAALAFRDGENEDTHLDLALEWERYIRVSREGGMPLMG